MVAFKSRKGLTKLAVLLPLLLVVGCAMQSKSVSDASASRAFPEVQAAVDAAVRDGRVPGIVVAVGVNNEPTRFFSAGELTVGAGAAPSQDSLWRIYSMTKPITAIAAMILVDEGKLKLDQPISDIIPEFGACGVFVDPAKSLDTRPAIRPITVRHLLTHTSGLGYFADNSLAGLQLNKTGVVPFQLNRSSEAQVRALRPTTLQEFASRAAKTGLVADPGTRFSYSLSLDVLAAVIEKVAGMPFETFVQKRILTPLGMSSTYWQVVNAGRRLRISGG